jgi:predicted GNAT family acetyltransferase
LFGLPQLVQVRIERGLGWVAGSWSVIGIGREGYAWHVEAERVQEAEADLRIEDDPATSRYRLWLGDEFAAYGEYEDEPGRRIFTHTVVRPKFEGRGIGSRLAKFAVEDARAQGLRITPVCPFIRSWLERHHDYDSIVDFPEDGADEEASAG